MILSETDWHVRINIAGLTYCSPDWHFISPVFRDFDLWVVLEGKGTLDTPRGVHPVGSGDCFILRAGEKYEGRHDPAAPLTVAHVHFDFVDAKGRVFVPTEDRAPPFHLRMEHLGFFSELLHRIVEAWLTDEPVARTRAAAWLKAALLECEQQSLTPTYSGLVLEQFRRINEACETIMRNPGGSHRVEALAKEFFYSADHFSRVFKRFRGVTPRTFIVRARIEAAKSHLLTSSLSVTRIADILGYNDVYFFSRQFREKTGRTPTQWRQRGR